MKSRNILALTLSVVMIMSSFLAFYSVPPNETQFVPAVGTSAITFNMNVTINPDGSVTNSSAMTVVGNTYTLNGNLSGNLSILCSDCVVNGAGFSANGAYGDCGLYIGGVSNVLVSNITVVNSSNGVEIYNSAYITIVNLTAGSSNGYGIFAIQTEELTLRASNISAMSESIALEYANNTYLYNNDFTDASCVIDFENSNGFYSSNDTFQASNCAFFALESSSAYLSYDNLSGAHYGAEIEYSENIFITYSNLSEESTDGAYILYSGVVNLSHDVLNESLTSTNAVDLEYGYAPLFMSHDFINTTSDAVDLDESSYGIVISGSYVYVDDLFDANYSTQCTILTNDVIHATGTDLVSLYGVINSNVLVNNCTIIDSTNGARGIDIGSDSASNVTIFDNTFENVYYPVYLLPYVGVNCFIANNLFINSFDSITLWETVNTTIQENAFINCTNEAIYGSSVSNTYIYDNRMLNATYYAIDVEESSGDLVISDNVIINSTTTDGIYVYSGAGGEIFGNLLVNLDQGVYIEYSFDVNCYDNHFFNDSYSIYDDYNSGVNYFGNSIVNSTEKAFYSYTSSNSSIYDNIFQNATIYLLDLENTVNTQIYHNNFINAAGVRPYIYFVGNYLTTWNSSLPVGGNYWGDNPQNGQRTSGIGTDPYVFDSYDMDYYPLIAPWDPYSIQFTETGLPAGQLWNVTLGDSVISSNTGTITFTPSAAQHVQVPYTVGSIPGYTASIYSGTVTLNTGNQTIAVAFAQTTYDVNFTESGLPSGTTWYVNSTSFDSGPISGSSYTVSLTNGSYTYTVSSSDKSYAPDTYSGSFAINGQTISESVTFTEILYTVLFSENGLPSGTIWYVNVSSDSTVLASPSGTGLLSVSLPNGTYSYTVTSANKTYAPASYTGSLNVDGASLSVTETQFSLITNRVSFAETGLPAGTSWSLALGGYLKSTTSTQISFSVPNGTYSCVIPNVPGYSASYQSSITVNSATQNVSIQFVKMNYTVTIGETGLASGTTWTFSLGGKEYTSNTTTATITLTAGSYSLNVSAPSGYNVSSPSSVNADNCNVTVSVAFVPIPSTTTSSSSVSLDLGLGIGAIVGVIAGVLGYMFYTRVGSSSGIKGKKKD